LLDEPSPSRLRHVVPRVHMPRFYGLARSTRVFAERHLMFKAIVSGRGRYRVAA
jgi:hypothetical protein